MTGMEIAQLAKQRLVEVTGLKPDTVSGLSKDTDGWHIDVDMIQLKRVPDASDVLATYEAVLDEQGALLRYERIRRYLRGDLSEES